MLTVALHRGTAAERRVRLRELNGDDEFSVDSSSPTAGIDLIARLAKPILPGDLDAEAASSLSVSERDRVLLGLYQRLYGQHIEMTAACTQCNEPFEFGLSVQDLERVYDGAPAPNVDGSYETESGSRFRLPRTKDLLEAAAAGKEAVTVLFERCLVDLAEGDTPDSIEDAMEVAGPALDFDVGASCPACGGSQPVRVSLQSHLLGMLALEQRWLVREVHRLASAYGWQLRDILSLARSRRRLFASMVEAEWQSGRRRRP